MNWNIKDNLFLLFKCMLSKSLTKYGWYAKHKHKNAQDFNISNFNESKKPLPKYGQTTKNPIKFSIFVNIQKSGKNQSSTFITKSMLSEWDIKYLRMFSNHPKSMILVYVVEATNKKSKSKSKQGLR